LDGVAVVELDVGLLELGGGLDVEPLELEDGLDVELLPPPPPQPTNIDIVKIIAINGDGLVFIFGAF
jgi:hypothetical protein